MNIKVIICVGVAIFLTSAVLSFNRSTKIKNKEVKLEKIATIYPSISRKSPDVTLYLQNKPFLRFRPEENSEPEYRGKIVADSINQLPGEKIDPEQITVRWNGADETYTIQVIDRKLFQINAHTILANGSGNLAEDAIEATNRLRSLLGGPPLSNGVLAQVRQLKGIAFWYGPKFQNRLTANGEIFNQKALTAAHKTLPFNTKVEVTNLDNGKSVIVRINDRGPYISGRIIDLSAEAGRVIGIDKVGIAPVQLKILEPE